VATVSINQPSNLDPLMWTPGGSFTLLPSGGSIVNDYTFTKANGTVTTGRFPTGMAISGSTWTYPGFQTALAGLGYAFGDQIMLRPTMLDSSFNLVVTSTTTATVGLVPPPTYPPANTLMPDVAAAVVIRLKYAPQIQALCQDRVSIVLKSDWKMPKYAIIVTGAAGPGPDVEIDRYYSRLDIRFFGPGDDYNVRQRNAMQLWRTAHPILCPPVAMRIPASFHAAHTIVHNVRQDLAPMRMTEPGTDWPIVLVPYIASYVGQSI
jgi:hypothetical protein